MELALQYAAGGYVGRASGRDFDARRNLGYPPYDELAFDVPVLKEGDVNARVWIRIREVEQSLSLVEQILQRLPGGPVRVDIGEANGPREGMALSRVFAAMSWSGSASPKAAWSSDVTCVTRHGFNGRCLKQRSRETSSPTFRSATNRSTAPIRAMISKGMLSCASFSSRA